MPGYDLLARMVCGVTQLARIDMKNQLFPYGSISRCGIRNSSKLLYIKFLPDNSFNHLDFFHCRTGLRLGLLNS